MSNNNAGNVGNIKHSRTNKYFRDKFRGMAGTRKTGHLVKQDREGNDVLMEEAELLYIITKKKFKNGWHVRLTNGEEYDCYYEAPVMVDIDSNKTPEKEIPKQTTMCTVSIDKVSGVYKITKINNFSNYFLTTSSTGLKIETGDSQDVLSLVNGDAGIKIMAIGQEASEIALKAKSLKMNDVNILDELEILNKRLDELEKQGIFTPEITD